MTNACSPSFRWRSLARDAKALGRLLRREAEAAALLPYGSEDAPAPCSVRVFVDEPLSADVVARQQGGTVVGFLRAPTGRLVLAGLGGETARDEAAALACEVKPGC